MKVSPRKKKAQTCPLIKIKRDDRRRELRSPASKLISYDFKISQIKLCNVINVINPISFFPFSLLWPHQIASKIMWSLSNKITMTKMTWWKGNASTKKMMEGKRKTINQIIIYACIVLSAFCHSMFMRKEIFSVFFWVSSPFFPYQAQNFPSGAIIYPLFATDD